MVVLGAHLLACRLEGEQHVRPGVPVRHREDVQLVYLVTVLAQPGLGAEQRAAEEDAVAARDLRHRRWPSPPPPPSPPSLAGRRAPPPPRGGPPAPPRGSP